MPKDTRKTQTINDKIAELDHALEWFYGDDFRLDQALEKYQSASKMAGEIDRELTNLKNQVELVEDFTKS